MRATRSAGRNVLPGLVVLAALTLAPAAAQAQRGGQRPGTTTIEIRGQVPTPQVVTVRPRDVPTYSRRVLTPTFYNRSFWPSVLPAYQLVAMRQVRGAALAGAGVAPTATGLDLEIEALRRELDLRRAQLDTIEVEVQNLGNPNPPKSILPTPNQPPAGTPPRRPSSTTPADTTRRP